MSSKIWENGIYFTVVQEQREGFYRCAKFSKKHLKLHDVKNMDSGGLLAYMEKLNMKESSKSLCLEQRP